MLQHKLQNLAIESESESISTNSENTRHEVNTNGTKSKSNNLVRAAQTGSQNDTPECLKVSRTALPRNMSVVPDHMLLNPTKKDRRGSGKKGMCKITNYCLEYS